MTELPDWAVGAPGFSPVRPYLPVVCTGYVDERCHTMQAIGVYFPFDLADPPDGWFDRPSGSWHLIRRDDESPWQLLVREVGPALAGNPREALPRPRQRFIESTSIHPVPRREERGGRVYNWTSTEGQGSVVTSCPACKRVHRVARSVWWQFLEDARASGAPWADVSGLD